MSARTPPKKMARQIAEMLEKQSPDAAYVKKVFSHVRDSLGLKGTPAGERRLPELLSDVELRRFYEAVWKEGHRVHTVLVKVLIYTGVRNAELAELLVEDVDLQDLKLRIRQGKGGKDRFVPFPAGFRGELAQYVEGQRTRGCRYLFETHRRSKFTTRWVRMIVKRYADAAGITKRMYPHLFRHQILTFLARKGLLDRKIQLMSGHKNRRSLEVYQALSLADVAEEYQEAMKDFPFL